jgi:predicted TIM-barrel fold metal-dependent hydrolase
MKRARGAYNRREFLGAAGLVAATARAPRQQAEAGPRVDCQSHLFVPEVLALMEKRQASPRVERRGGERFVVVGEWVRRVLPKHTDVGAKLADMDAAGIDLTALSTNDPGPELFGRDGPGVARAINDHIGGVARAHPKRFFGLAVLPLQEMDAALVELDRCVGKLGMRGILLYSNLGGKFPDLPEFRPLFRRAEELDVPVLLHPAYPTTYEATKGYEMAAGLGLMFDTSIALCRIILAGILDQHPKLKLVCPHVGGTLPYIIGRIDHQTQVLKRGAENIRRPPSEYLREVYFDIVSPLALTIRYGYDFAGPDRLLFATDHPWVDPQLIVRNLESLKLAPADEEKIFGGNARRLFRL